MEKIFISNCVHYNSIYNIFKNRVLLNKYMHRKLYPVTNVLKSNKQEQLNGYYMPSTILNVLPQKTQSL